MKMGSEALLEDKKLLKLLKGKKIGLICHPASVNENLQHSFSLYQAKMNIACAFGPQHGIQGEKQDNMIESEDFIHPQYKIPVFSLYGRVRRPTKQMMDIFDIALFDLQDLGCRIYTFITTLLYMMEECAKYKKTLIVLDRPNPAGRYIEGFSLEPGWESFVGAGPIPMRHGLTVGELALYFKSKFKLDIDLKICSMKTYSINKQPGFGWPADRTWINPSPNAANLNMARCYSGTVLLEGTNLSEGRGTTRPLEVIGASDINFSLVLAEMKKIAPQWLRGAALRECYFEPTFHKFEKKICHGFQIHTDIADFKPALFKPFRLIAVTLKAIRKIYPEYELYRNFAYEYVENKLPFDVINGGPKLRDWIEDQHADSKDLENALLKDEKNWQKERAAFLIYK
jgi:uncharacterized protein YbbC (DUF1343 family)